MEFISQDPWEFYIAELGLRLGVAYMLANYLSVNDIPTSCFRLETGMLGL